MADAGPGTISSLCGMLFMAATGARLTPVPYKGTGPAMNDLLGKQVDLLCDATSTCATHIAGGKIKAFGLTGRSRLSSMPGLPTLDEQGLKGFEVVVWQALFAPRNLPKPVVDVLVSSLQTALTDADLNAYFDRTGSQGASKDLATPAALSAYVKSEVEKWGPILKKAGATLD
jgi:tripartite-type tricarboxylate transporter receptor subunit TctC